MKRHLIAGVLLLSACGATAPPKTPAQALIEGYAALGSATAAFNVYAGQRPFCGDAGAKPAPLCADRDIVIQGDAAAHQVADAMDRAGAVIKAVNVADTQWAALVEPENLLAQFRALVARVTGGK